MADFHSQRALPRQVLKLHPRLLKRPSSLITANRDCKHCESIEVNVHITSRWTKLRSDTMCDCHIPYVARLHLSMYISCPSPDMYGSCSACNTSHTTAVPAEAEPSFPACNECQMSSRFALRPQSSTAGAESRAIHLQKLCAEENGQTVMLKAGEPQTRRVAQGAVKLMLITSQLYIQQTTYQQRRTKDKQ